jgi:hypothetical protein
MFRTGSGFACAALMLAVSCGAPQAGETELPPDLARSLEQAVSWIESHLVNSRNTPRWPESHGVTYEFGRDEIYRPTAPPRNCRAIRSFDFPRGHKAHRYMTRFGRSMVYDNALAVICLTMLGKHDDAKGILATLDYLQSKDGSVGFSFNTHGDNFLNKSYLRCGVQAWAGFACVFYTVHTGDRSFLPFAERVAGWIRRQQIQDRDDPRFGLPTGGYGRWDPKNQFVKGRMTWCACEHAVDSFFFFDLLARTTGKAEHARTADEIGKALVRALWSEKEGRLYAAVSPEGVDRTQALDNVSWGGMALLAMGHADKARRCLAYADRHFRTTHQEIRGYAPYTGRVPDYPTVKDWSPVWSEGSSGVCVLSRKLGDRKKAESIAREMVKLQVRVGDVRGFGPRAVGGVLYSSKELPDFPAVPSAAGTCWHVISLMTLESDKWRDAFWGSAPRTGKR